MSAASPYLGCKISLISKAEIRYEGLLYSIDAQESTVALANVRSFGTENRPTERPIPPRNEVFELIIFRGSDIKDLHVSEPPNKPAAAAPWPQDPAIVEASQPIPAGRIGAGDGLPTLPQTQAPKPTTYPSAGFPTLPFMSGTAPSPLTQPVVPPPAAKPAAAPAAPAPTISYASQVAAKPDDRGIHGSDGAGSSESGHQAEPRSQSAQQRERHNDGSKPAAGRGRTMAMQPQGPPPPQDYSMHGGRGGGRPRGGHDGSRGGHDGPRGGHDGPRSGHDGPRGGYDGPRGGHHDGPRGGYDGPRGGHDGPRGPPRGGRGGGPPPPRSQGRPQQPNAPNLDQEFDFESSNAKFDKEKFEKEFEEKLAINDDKGSETEKDEGEANSQFYDKKKSFFDSISCQSLDTESTGRGRGANADSRRLNTETFGNTVFRGGRRGGYGGGRGGYGPRPQQNSYGPRDGGRMYSGGPPQHGYNRRMNNGGGRYDDDYEPRRPGRGRYAEY